MLSRVRIFNKTSSEILNFNNSKAAEKEFGNIKNEHHNNLIIISVNEGFSFSTIIRQQYPTPFQS